MCVAAVPILPGLFVSPQSGGPATTRRWEAPLDEGCNCGCHIADFQNSLGGESVFPKLNHGQDTRESVFEGGVFRNPS